MPLPPWTSFSPDLANNLPANFEGLYKGVPGKAALSPISVCGKYTTTDMHSKLKKLPMEKCQLANGLAGVISFADVQRGGYVLLSAIGEATG